MYNGRKLQRGLSFLGDGTLLPEGRQAWRKQGFFSSRIAGFAALGLLLPDHVKSVLAQRRKIENPLYRVAIMARESQIPSSAVKTETESIGQRIACLRKERGLTQKQLAEKLGIIQVLISDYEKGKLRLHAEMVGRFARALGVKADELLGLTVNSSAKSVSKPDLKIMRRLNRNASLPPNEQKIMLRAIDSWLQASQWKTQ